MLVKTLTKYLTRNKPLFSMIDSIILDDSETTRQNLIRALSGNQDLSTVPNLLYKKTENADFQILQSATQPPRSPKSLNHLVTHRPEFAAPDFSLSPSVIANIKIFPDNACTWNKCSFCGINKKYHPALTENQTWNVRAAVDLMQTLRDQHVRYVWLTDEAIPAPILWQMARELTQRQIALTWQARARFSEEFLNKDLCVDLAQAGLKEIRFGLESGSPRILKAMNKFPDSINLAVIDQIVETCDKAGISVHCPTIIGTPTETAQDRAYTYAFLRHLSEKNQGFTFNINIFGLDVNSPIFSAWEKYGISSIKFPCQPEHFLGNLVEWNSHAEPFNAAQLDDERESIMREYLYPWMPASSTTTAFQLYRLTETIRSTLTFKHLYPPTPESPAAPERAPTATTDLHLPAHVILTRPAPFAAGESQLYDWRNHKAVHITPDLAELIEKSQETETPIRPYAEPAAQRNALYQLHRNGFLSAYRAT